MENALKRKHSQFFRHGNGVGSVEIPQREGLGQRDRLMTLASVLLPLALVL